ncbi:MAG: hypothetical protein LBH74_07285 [Nitrososphaerota archaeon]|jgi:hypothetical protein|uniref:hypothetical protein n=1 Tax=Candidatus Bathycorpusculum sp. TaxID=2994959 RepID=UPI00283795FA|nr:hypothetical protein [Candidatus Termitimicrobium sp.]MCL2431927.1 hypothetical protein [Candidatus Termitimicrobium sp.]MDR0493421.1 hypothetical protein [Nitrososphaerota archaeon]
MTKEGTQQKRIVGGVAVTLILIVTIFAILGYITFIEWILADLIIAGIANLLFRKISKPQPL